MLRVLATPLGNAYSHVSYLVRCSRTGEALAVDPWDVELTLETARTNDLKITRIVNTHEHWDHAGRNEQLRVATGAKVFAARAAAGVIENLDGTFVEGDRVEFGEAALEVMETPGHTMTHISLLGEEDGEPVLLCGDTVFGAGVGNCGYGGHAPTLYRTIAKLRSRLSPKTRVYPGHDYLARNLEFTLHFDHENRAAAERIEEARERTVFTTFADELEFNLFFRLEDPVLRASLVEAGQLAPKADSKQAFLSLRRLRDSW